MVLHLTGCEREYDAKAVKSIEESWRYGDVYMYQEPEPVHLWPTPTRWGKLTARVRIWYRRLVEFWRLS
jgi:hypothetical protein